MIEFDKEGKQFSFIYPKSIDGKAEKIADQRIKINKNSMGYYYDSYYYRGMDSRRVEILGVKAELIVREYLKANDICFEATKIIDKQPIKQPDIIIDRHRFDVKGVEKNDVELRVNQKAHIKTKNIDMYWFVKLTKDCDSVHYFFKHSTVSNWVLLQKKYTSAYCLSIYDIIKRDDLKGYDRREHIRFLKELIKDTDAVLVGTTVVWNKQ